MGERAEVIAFEAYGVALAVAVEHTCSVGGCSFPDLRPQTVAMLPPGAVPLSPDAPVAARFGVQCCGDRLRLHRPDTPERSFRRRDRCLHRLDGSIRSVVAQLAPGLVFVHAGAVALDGRAVVLPGRSRAGKTTLVAALVRAGAGYLSDEYAVVGPDGLVHPYPRRLSVREGDGRREVPVAEIGGTVAEGPLPVGLVAALEFQPGAAWAVAPGGGGACAMALVANAVAARARSREVLGATAAVARSARFVEGVRGEVDDAVGRLLRLAGADEEAVR